MKNKEIEELLNRLKDNNDWYVIENKEEHNIEPYKLLLPTERDLLLSYIEQLENNRDDAIEMLETYKRMLSLYSQPVNIFDLQDVIDELEGDNK